MEIVCCCFLWLSEAETRAIDISVGRKHFVRSLLSPFAAVRNIFTRFTILKEVLAY